MGLVGEKQPIDREPRMTLTFRPITTQNWPDFEALMQARGSPHNCWCTAWIDVAKGAKKPEKKAAMQARIEADVPVGLLAYLDGAAIGWCAIAPRETYRKLGGDETKQRVWSVVCFFIQRAYRGQGYSKVLLKEAVDYAAKQGAEFVEGYPVAKESPSYRFMGFVPLFEGADFEFVKPAGARRNVMLKKLA